MAALLKAASLLHPGDIGFGMSNASILQHGFQHVSKLIVAGSAQARAMVNSAGNGPNHRCV
jgi:hypothetical protein